MVTNVKKPRAANGEGCLRRRTRLNAEGVRVPYGNLLFQIRVGPGNPKSTSLGTLDAEDAEAKKKVLLADMRGGDKINGRTPVSIYARKWLEGKIKRHEQRDKPSLSSLKRYKDHLINFMAFLEKHFLLGVPIEDLRSRHFDDYVAFRRKQTQRRTKSDTLISPEGINQELDFLRMVFKSACANRLIEKNPLADVAYLDTEPKDGTLPTPDQLAEIFGFVDEPMILELLKVYASTGMRSGEGRHRQFKHFDFERNTISIRPEIDFTPKNPFSIRSMPCPEEVEEVVKRIKDERGDVSPNDYVYCNKDGVPLVEREGSAYYRLTKAWKAANKARREAGRPEIPKINIRLLRHWNSSWSANRTENPVPEMQLAKCLGHSGTETLNRVYFHPDLQGELAQRMRATPLFKKKADAVEVNVPIVASTTADNGPGKEQHIT